ncbi:nucleotidyltransferase domain-containing protein [uncultured Sphingomonas sp.]|uniref:nucleotidyltransferase domain-containing protein n=1 Tax=uncultured Sphingomonas sp. TaxID=158754 RepID=UPI0025F4721D|nr:nucleotidyltransferase domain-containing protein [uncultured Sphingomonas sp.]
MGRLLGLYVFGSVARGDQDASSDLDLLAVVADGEGKVPDETVSAHVPPALAGLEISISWYGRRRLGQMFANGELFAWHLHGEAVPLYESEPVMTALGRPAPYFDAAADIASFEKVLAGIPAQLWASPGNAAYELGLVYVCVRNIAMAASAVLCPQPDFSRYSPFRLEGFPEVPLTPAEYGLAMRCRMAGQRGLAPVAAVGSSQVAGIHARIAPWIDALRVRLEEV